MASEAALILRRAEALGRLTNAKSRLQELVSVEFTEQPLTNRDEDIARIQELENIAGYLEALAEKIAQTQEPLQEPEPEPILEPLSEPPPEPPEPEPEEVPNKPRSKSRTAST